MFRWILALLIATALPLSADIALLKRENLVAWCIVPFDAMKPHLFALNLNGMIDDGEALGKKILPPGDGTRELEMLRHVVKSGWQGPVGILDHLPETDSAVTLRGNLAALERLNALLEKPAAE